MPWAIKRAAEEYFKNGIAFGNEAGNYYFFARWLKDNGRKDEAIDNLYKSIRLVDARMDARSMLIPLLYEQKRYEELKTVCQPHAGTGPRRCYGNYIPANGQQRQIAVAGRGRSQP
jgi:hypothetical protein